LTGEIAIDWFHNRWLMQTLAVDLKQMLVYDQTCPPGSDNACI
jgi:hypothetical protein